MHGSMKVNFLDNTDKRVSPDMITITHIRNASKSVCLSALNPNVLQDGN
jgi:hypothetical protein